MMNVKASERRALEEQFYAIPFIDHKRNSIRKSCRDSKKNAACRFR